MYLWHPSYGLVCYLLFGFGLLITVSFDLFIMIRIVFMK